MKIYVCNDSDPSIMRKIDSRSYAAHGLWFLNPGDVAVLMDVPDPAFVDHVLAVKEMPTDSVDVCVMPEGRYERKMFDQLAIVDSELINDVLRTLRNRKPDTVDALWMTPGVSEFAHQLGLNRAVPGFAFFQQNGYELANSKGNFRALAAASGLPIPHGRVLRDAEEAKEFSQKLLSRDGAYMAKRSHGGGGGGNYLVHLPESTAVPEESGAVRVYQATTPEAANAFWDSHWSWMSYEDRYPVVVEEFVGNHRTFYAEYSVGDGALPEPSVGELVYRDRGLAVEINPADDQIPAQLRGRMQTCSHQLASIYQGLGYRGHVSVDWIVTDSGKMRITEVNCRYTGSTHMYEVMRNLPGIHGDRHVLQTEIELLRDEVKYADFLTLLSQVPHGYNRTTGEGTVALTPPLGGAPDVMHVMLNTVARSRDDAFVLLANLKSDCVTRGWTTDGSNE
ncbi:hypothetical protein [Arthrobacter silvisoli]|uniref:preATP grasp domain-containing protein n=1 Tax=Arthrobacter silvisoli TaxID=2291022 RepID=UPI000E2198FC|nr:hypothetical protein [Arthrobacter silvisoli]